MNVRRARDDDVESVCRLLDEATSWVRERGYEQWPQPFPRKAMAASIDRGEVFVVEADNGLAATLTLLDADPTFWGDRPPDALYLHKLVVRRDHAGQRMGARLIQWATGQVRGAQRRFLRLDCWLENAGIRAYYERLGFEHRGSVEFAEWRASLYECEVDPTG